MKARLRPTTPRPVPTAAIVLLAALLITASLVAIVYHWQPGKDSPNSQEATPDTSGASASVPASFSDNFRTRSTLQESGSMQQSSSQSWWLNSGGIMTSRDGQGQTIHGNLPPGAKWRREYAKNNPVDSDNGAHPQNLFRLVTRSRFRQVVQEAYFRIDANQLSQSPRRNESNGLLMFNRYQDGDNLYYTGLRVDGHAIIKKKFRGKYYTMAESRIFPGDYDRRKNPNLLPKNAWIGVRSLVITRPDGQTEVELWSDAGKPGEWRQLLSVADDGRRYGGAAITAGGYGGIRTDFMDVSFRDYSIRERPN